jgi:hypothetical protein
VADFLHLLLLALTLTDLAFVQATDVVAGSELLPLWLLAAASPWLRRMQRFVVYRMAWNLGVLLVFALLVRHATTTGLLHMLEDGLLLAVLCQVHLLNNVGERQRPDLVFFNSFLIAFVTSLFAPDLSWSLLFVLHALVLVPALQINVLARRSGPVAPAVARAVLNDSLPRTLAVGAATALVFVAWPRDFQRKGWIEDAVALRQHLEAGFAEQIRLDHELPMHLGNEVVLRITPSSGRPEDVPSHWRGIAFSVFEGSSWLPQDARNLGPRFATDVAWEARADGGWQRPLPVAPGELRVRLEDTSGKRLFTPLQACELRLTDDADLLVDPRSYGALAFVRHEDAPAVPIDYELRLGTGAHRVTVSARVREHLLVLPPDMLPQVVIDLAARLAAEAGEDADPATLAMAGCRWLQEHRRYQVPGGPGFARNLGEFLVGSGAGHCEYFATALALLLRLQNVPCRLVGGYLAHEWDAAAAATVVRARHAHAWVEALLPDGSWLTLDPTPPSSLTDARTDGGSWWDNAHDELQQLWNGVVGFDPATRARLFAALCDLPADAGRAAAEHPFALAAILAMVFGLRYVRRRRRQSLPEIVAFVEATRAAGLQLRPGETPRDLLGRAAAAAIPPDRFAALQAAARQHEAMRYGGARSNRP